MPEPPPNLYPARARDHLANERTFLAWVRTGIAIVVFGFAIGRFAIAMRQWFALQGKPQQSGGLSVWFGLVAIVSGILLTLGGLLRYRRTRDELESGQYNPKSTMVNILGLCTMLFGIALAAYLMFIAARL